jgi:RNA polymerase sigma factor (sigma-70 family)
MSDPAWGRLLARDLDTTFPQLVEATQDRLHAGVVRFVGDRTLADDICQDVFVRAYRSLVQMPDAQRLALRVRPWLWTIALNRCRSWGRRESTRPLEVELDPSWADGGHRPHDEVEETLVWRERLAALSDPQRTAVVLRHVGRFSYAEIAHITGRPEGTVKADAHRGVARLRRALETEEAR